MRATGTLEMLRQVQARHHNSGFSEKQWEDFLLIYKGDVDKNLVDYIAWADQEIANRNGVAPIPVYPSVPLIVSDVDLSTLPLAPIIAEMKRLETLSRYLQCCPQSIYSFCWTNCARKQGIAIPHSQARRCTKSRCSSQKPSDRAGAIL